MKLEPLVPLPTLENVAACLDLVPLAESIAARKFDVTAVTPTTMTIEPRRPPAKPGPYWQQRNRWAG